MYWYGSLLSFLTFYNFTVLIKFMLYVRIMSLNQSIWSQLDFFQLQYSLPFFINWVNRGHEHFNLIFRLLIKSLSFYSSNCLLGLPQRVFVLVDHLSRINNRVTFIQMLDTTSWLASKVILFKDLRLIDLLCHSILSWRDVWEKKWLITWLRL